MNPKLVKKVCVGVLYIVVSFIVLIGLTQWMENLRIAGARQFRAGLLFAPIILFPLIVSVIFSHKHIIGLFLQKGRLEIKIANLVVSAIILATVSMSYVYHDIPQLFQRLLNELRMPLVYFTRYGEIFFHIVFWYNLIYAFERKPHNSISEPNHRNGMALN